MRTGESIIKKIISFLITLLLVLSVLLCVVLTVKGITGKDSGMFGFRVFYVVTGSMEPTIHTGAVILTKASPTGQYEVGDVITFATTAAEIYGQPNTHRIIGIVHSDAGDLYVTQGDANNVPDADPVSPSSVYGKVIRHTGDMRWLGTLLGFIATPLGFISMIMIPVLLLSGSLLRDFTRECRQAVKEQAEAEYLAQHGLKKGDFENTAANRTQERSSSEKPQ